MPVEPTTSQMAAALLRLDRLAALAVFGQIGGVRPRKDDRATCWWGGNFLGAEGEAVPVCARSGRAMHPVLQLRVDELPEIPPALRGIALLTLWMDLKASGPWGQRNGDGFCVRTYPALAPLRPLGPGFRESQDLPTFPVLWRETALEQPGWEDMAAEIPAPIARASAEEWFFHSRHASDRYHAVRAACPIKLGGWPQWIQGSQWPEGAEHVLQVESSEKGRLFLGDAGSVYVFKGRDGWALRHDCY